MIQFIYVSKRAPDFDDHSLQEMVQKAQVTNTAIGLTGILLHRGGWVLQLLEGQKAYVDFTKKKIITAPRHSSIHILNEEIGGKRLFSGWLLAYKKLDEDTSELSSLMEEIVQLQRKFTSFELMQLMQRFR